MPISDHIFDCTDPTAINCAPWCEQCGFNNPGEQDWPGTIIDCSWPDGYTGAFEWNYYQNPGDIGPSIPCRYDCIDMFDECTPNPDGTSKNVFFVQPIWETDEGGLPYLNVKFCNNSPWHVSGLQLQMTGLIGQGNWNDAYIVSPLSDPPQEGTGGHNWMTTYIPQDLQLPFVGLTTTPGNTFNLIQPYEAGTLFKVYGTVPDHVIITRVAAVPQKFNWIGQGDTEEDCAWRPGHQWLSGLSQQAVSKPSMISHPDTRGKSYAYTNLDIENPGELNGFGLPLGHPDNPFDEAIQRHIPEEYCSGWNDYSGGWGMSGFIVGTHPHLTEDTQCYCECFNPIVNQTVTTWPLGDTCTGDTQCQIMCQAHCIENNYQYNYADCQESWSGYTGQLYGGTQYQDEFVWASDEIFEKTCGEISPDSIFGEGDEQYAGCVGLHGVLHTPLVSYSSALEEQCKWCNNPTCPDEVTNCEHAPLYCCFDTNGSGFCDDPTAPAYYCCGETCADCFYESDMNGDGIPDSNQMIELDSVWWPNGLGEACPEGQKTTWCCPHSEEECECDDDYNPMKWEFGCVDDFGPACSPCVPLNKKGGDTPYIEVDLTAFQDAIAEGIFGCNDPFSWNYHPYAGSGCESGDMSCCDYDGDGIPDGLPDGCPEDICGDGTEENPILYGCMEPACDNYRPNATMDDGSCCGNNHVCGWFHGVCNPGVGSTPEAQFPFDNVRCFPDIDTWEFPVTDGGYGWTNVFNNCLYWGNCPTDVESMPWNNVDYIAYVDGNPDVPGNQETLIVLPAPNLLGGVCIADVNNNVNNPIEDIISGTPYYLDGVTAFGCNPYHGSVDCPGHPDNPNNG